MHKSYPKITTSSHAQSHALTIIYDLFDISVFHLDIPTLADNHYLDVASPHGMKTRLQDHFPHLHCPVAPLSWPLAIASISRYPPCQQPRATWQHYIRAVHGPYRLSRPSFLPTRVRDVPEHTDKHHPAQHPVPLPYAPHPHTLDFSADNADACVTWLAGIPHIAALVMTPALRAHLPAHGPSFVLALALALRSMRSFSVLMLPAFEAELLAAALGTLTHLMLLTDTLPYPFLDDLLAAPACARLTHRTTSHPPLLRTFAVFDRSPGLAAALTYLRLLHRVTLRVASTLYNDLCPVALYSVLSSSLRVLVLVLASDVDVLICERLLAALGNTDAGLEVLEVSLNGTSNEVSLQSLNMQVSSLLPNVQALRKLHLRTSLPSEAAEADRGSLQLVLWIRSPLRSALPCVVFPLDAHWEPERGEWLCVN
ncbi:hypothetical protein H4582DRAFT_2100435 [Lactarius indigo]|nr:hypothetical protein H4582DRAFT_2100435 [Lactarius indigo]